MNEVTPDLRPTTSANCGLAIASLILGILSLVCCGLLSGIPAVICGHMAVAQIKKSGGALGGNGLAVAGLVMGYIGIVVTILFLVLGGVGAVLSVMQQQQ